jgi:hypothetical protein
MIVLAVAAFVLFWLRDYSALRMGPPRRTTLRLSVYVISMAVTAMLVWLVAARDGSFLFSRINQSSRLVFALAAWQVAATVACLWLRSTKRYDLAWLAAVIPAPAFWTLSARIAFGAGNTPGEPWSSFVYCAVFASWVSLMTLTFVRARPVAMPADELDFAVNMAGWSNCVGIGLVALAASA